MDELDKLKEIFLDPTLDEEERADNLAQINDWEKSIRNSTLMLSWQEHDMTRKIVSQAKEAYRSNAVRLAETRTLTEAQRNALFSKQDALLYIINLASADPRTEIKSIKATIRRAIEI